MESLFEYRRIGHDFQRELTELVSSGTSVVLLSLRDLGKRYVLKYLGEALRNEGSVIVVEVEFPHEPAILVPSEVQKLIKIAAEKAAPNFAFSESASPDDLLNLVNQLCQSQPRRVVLLASNVDSLAHHLAQTFLREARVLVSNPQFPLTAVLTGEENLSDLVYGAESEFNCAQQFVLQGFDEAEFIDYLRRRRETARIAFVDEETCLRLLFQETQGNTHLSRAALWAWLETRARISDVSDRRVSTPEFADFLARFPISETCGMDAYYQTTRIVAAAPESWDDLESLRQDRPVFVSLESAPHALELAGLTIRRDRHLQYASTIMRRFARCYYDDCRLGDLHAVSGDWEKAFQFYERMPELHRLRPGGAADVPRLALVIKALIAQMHTLVTRPGVEGKKKLNDLRDLFARGCKLVLGVSEVTFWKFTLQWEAHSSQSIEPAVRNLAKNILEGANRASVGWQRVPNLLGKRAAFAVLPSARLDWCHAVVVSDASRTVAISKKRGEFLHELLDQFASAYDHVVGNWRVKLRLAARHQHLEVATQIVTALGKTIYNPRHALRRAGKLLREKLGYRRITFSLIDVQGEQICGIEDCVDKDCPANIAEQTDYSLRDADADVQPWVVARRAAVLVDDWHTWNQARLGFDARERCVFVDAMDERSEHPKLPPINRPLAEKAQTRPSFAVLPMLLRSDRAVHPSGEDVIGTIHVERGDWAPLSREDAEDLLEFGRQLAAAVHQAERIHALHEALRGDDDGVLIFDDEQPQPRVCFINDAAIGLLGLDRNMINPGWLDAPHRINLHGTKGECWGNHVINSVLNGQRHAHYDTELGQAIVCTPLNDWRTRKQPSGREDKDVSAPAMGAVMHIYDLTGLLGLFAALRSIAESANDSESMTEALLKCVDKLPFLPKIPGLLPPRVGARMYERNKNDPDLLVSKQAAGLADSFAEKFKGGEYRMGRQDPAGKETWWCLEHLEPRVYRWNPDCDDGKKETTPSGLEFFNVKKPAFTRTWKKPGDYWIDLPLLAGTEAVGKLTVDIGHEFRCDLKPEDFELLKLFSALLGALLAALDKEQWVREAADRAMSDCAHIIGTKLAGLDGFADRYRRAAPDNARVEEKNQLHEPVIRECFEEVERIKQTFGGTMDLQRTPTQMLRLLEMTLESKLGHDRETGQAAWQVICPEELIVSVDERRVRNTLEALLDNSRTMLPTGKTLELRLCAKTFRHDGKEWLRLSVGDNGPGIPADQRKRVFEPFYSRRPGGKRSTGLGLSYAQRVITEHGGKIWITESGGPGAEFIIEIPSS